MSLWCIKMMERIQDGTREVPNGIIRGCKKKMFADVTLVYQDDTGNKMRNGMLGSQGKVINEEKEHKGKKEACQYQSR